MNAAVITSNVVTGNWGSTSSWVGGVVPGNGDTVVIAGGAVIHVPDARTVGASTGTGTLAAITLGTTGQIIVDAGGSLVSRGDISTGNATNLAMTVNGSLTLDSSLATGGTRYTWTAAAARQLVLQGNSSTCTFAIYVGWSGAGCAVLTSLPANANDIGDINTGFYEGNFAFDYAAVSNLGSAGQDAVRVRANAFGGTPDAHFTHTSFLNSGMIEIQGMVDTLVQHTYAFGGINTQGSGQDIQIEDDGLGVTNTMTDSVFSNGYKFLSSNTWNMSRLYTALNPTFSTSSGMSASTCNETIILGAGDYSMPCAAINYLMLLRDATGTTGHFLDIPGTAINPGTTMTISNTYCEFPDQDTMSNQGKCLLYNGAEPTSPTIANVGNVLLVPSKVNIGNAELIGGSGVVSEANSFISVEHATAFVQGGGTTATTVNQFESEDEGGVSNNTINSLRANIMLSDGPFFKTVSFATTTPSNNTVLIADYNVAATARNLTNSLCTGCTNQANSVTTKCTPGAGITCPGGPHDLDIVAGAPVAANFADVSCGGFPCARMATWDTLGPPAHAVCTAWVTGTVYTYVASAPICVSVSNSGVYGAKSINYILQATHTSGASTKPDSGANWRTDWTYRSLVDFQTDLINGTTYAGNSTVKAFWVWAGTGWVPTNNAYRTTYPGDTSVITNMGAFQMAPKATGSGAVNNPQ